MDDERALVEAARRDPEAFGELYSRHVDPIFSYIFHRVHNRADAEDLTALVFSRALSALNGFDWRSAPFRAWLYRIAGNAVVDYWRRWRERLPLEEAARLPDPGPTPAEAAEVSELRARLHAAIAALPDPQQEAIVLHFAQGLTYRQVGEVLGRTEGAAKQLVHRALVALRAALEEDVDAGT